MLVCVCMQMTYIPVLAGVYLWKPVPSVFSSHTTLALKINSFFFYFIPESSICRHVSIDLKKKFKTLDDAEAALGISVQTYIDGSPNLPSEPSPSTDDLNLSPSLVQKLSCLSQKHLIDLITEGLSLLGTNFNLAELLTNFLNKASVNALNVVEQLYLWLAQKMGISSSVLGFVELSLAAMQRSQANNKVNFVVKFCQCLAIDRPDKSGPLMPIHRMPFGLIQYCIEFFTCTNVMQVITC